MNESYSDIAAGHQADELDLLKSEQAALRPESSAAGARAPKEELEVEVAPKLTPKTKESNSAANLPVLRPKAAPPVKTPAVPVPYDSLKTYLRELRNLPRLSREEEHDLAVRYKEEGDLNAAYLLVSSNLWLAVRIAREYERAARNILDLIQEGNIGLMEAIKNFDPYRGVRFPSYAVWWIKAYIIRYLIANWRLVKIGTTQAQRKLFFNLHKEKEKLEREGFRPTPKLLADKLNVREQEVIEMEQRLGAPDMSFDAPLSADSDSSLLTVLPAEGDTAEEILNKKQLKRSLADSFEIFAETLNDKERTIFWERMLADEKVTLQDMSDKLGVSRERIRQLENRVKSKLRTFLLEKFGDLAYEFIPE